jgi:hypothetical protein
MRPEMKFFVSSCAFFAIFMSFTFSAQSATLGGTWSGSGYVKPKQGERENVRCRVTYSQKSNKIYGVSATCASSSQSIRQTGELLMIRPNRYVGDFYNKQFDISGRIAVTISGSSQTVTFSSVNGGGQLTLRKR